MKKLLCQLAVYIMALCSLGAHAQTVFNCSSFTSSGTCAVSYGGSPTSGFRINDAGLNSGALTAPTVTLIYSGIGHAGVALIYQVPVDSRAFNLTYTFVPNGQTLAFVWENNTATAGGGAFPTWFVGGAGCETGLLQAFSSPPINNVMGIQLDSVSPLTNGGSFTYSSTQLYQTVQSPCNPNDGGPDYWFTTKQSTSPVPLNSPASTALTTTGDTYSVNITYDGSTVTESMYDVTAGGSCPGASCHTSTWSNVSVPALVDGTTAYVGIASAAGTTTTAPLIIESMAYTVETPTATPSFAAYNANSTTNPGTTTAATPVYSLAPGSYTGAQSVTMSCSTASSNMCYTLASSLPSILPQTNNIGGCQSGTAYTGAISVPSTSTLYAICGTNGVSNPSAVTAGTYTISASTPTFSPAAGIYAGTQNVTISSTPGAVICYNTTGSPATNGATGCLTGTIYSGPVSVSASETLYAVAGGTGFTSSSVGSASYTIAAGCSLSVGATTAQIQTALNSAGSNSCPGIGNEVTFGAGSYTITSGLTLPCGVTVTAAVPATPSNVVLNATAANIHIMQMSGGCTSGTTTIEYLHFNGAGALYFDANNYSNINILHNQVTSIPSEESCSGICEVGAYFDGYSGSTISNITIEYNTFGDTNSCVTGIGETNDDGNCAGILFDTVQPMILNNVIIRYNYFFHLLEGIHALPTPYVAGGMSAGAYGNNVFIEYNSFYQIHRIQVEWQIGVTSNPTYERYNVMGPPINSSGNDGMYAYSDACCQNSTIQSGGTTTYLDADSNIIYDNSSLTSTTNGISWAFEAWGNGAQYVHNLIQGYVCGGLEWGFGGTNNVGQQWSISNNTMQGAIMANGTPCPFYTPLSGSFIGNEFGQSPSLAPVMSGNVTGATPTAVTSMAPAISPSSGSQSFPLTVTLTDPGYSSGAIPFGNTGIWYTTDGTTPVPGSGSAQRLGTGGTFVLTGPATVQAVGMWGTPPQPTSYPSGFGFTPSSVVSAAYTTGGTPTLSSATIAPTGGVSALQIGGTVQMIVTCHYSDGSTSGCNTTDSHGNAVTSWASNSGNVTVSSSGLATAAAIGTATITATVTGGITTSPGAVITVNASPLTLSSISLATTGGVSSITAGTTNQLLTTCHYNDGTSTSCNTMDSHGNGVTAANSSAPTIATVTSPGALVTGVAAGSTNLTTTVTPTPSMLGTSLENVTGATGFGFINEVYGVTGTSASGYTPGNCHITIPATTNWTAGTFWTCLLVLAPTPTTQNASALCSNSYTLTGTSWPGGDIVIPMAGVCPTLPPDTGYWVASTTSQTTASPTQGFSNCNSSCSGGPPMFGSGTYPYRYVANTFGNYTNLPTTLTASGTPGQQISQYVLLTTTPVNSNSEPLTVNAAMPTLVSAYITGSSSVVVPNTAQMAAKCHYSAGADQDCTVADIYGDKVTAWLTSDATKATVQNVGAASPGLVTAVAAGTPSITAVINNAMNSTAFPITVTNPVVTLTGVSLSLTGGVTGLFVGTTNQLKATCTYSDGSHDDCTTTDVHGTLAHNYASATPAHATVNATSGLVTGVAPGTTTFTAVAGSFTSNALPLNVFPVLSGVYTITVSGPVKFSGTVQF